MSSLKNKRLWAVCRNLRFQYKIGKIQKETESCYWIKFMENEDSEPWEKRYVRAFDESLKSMAYFIFFTDPDNHRSHKTRIHREARGNAIQTFLTQFPSERNNIETLLGLIGISPSFLEYYKNIPNSSKSPFEIRGF